jgi:hypothetical protein
MDFDRTLVVVNFRWPSVSVLMPSQSFDKLHVQDGNVAR